MVLSTWSLTLARALAALGNEDGWWAPCWAGLREAEEIMWVRSHLLGPHARCADAFGLKAQGALSAAWRKMALYCCVKLFGSSRKLGNWWQLGGRDKQDEPMCLFHSGGLLRCILIFKLLRYHQVASPSWWGHAWDPGGGGAPSLDVYFCPCRFSLGSPASSHGPKTCSYLQISHNCMWSA